MAVELFVAAGGIATFSNRSAQKPFENIISIIAPPALSKTGVFDRLRQKL
jgi:hypothetical protein